jgi:hypothetical protein
MPKQLSIEDIERSSLRNDSIKNYASSLNTGLDAAAQARPYLNNTDRLTDDELDILYLQNDLARRIVDEKVDDAVRAGWKARAKDSGDVVTEPEHLDIASRVLKAGKEGRLYGGAHVWMVTNSRAYDQLMQPGEQIQNLVVLDRWEASPYEYIDDPRNKDFGEPAVYYVTPNNYGAVDTSVQGVQVHRSRLLTLGGNPIPSRLDHLNNGYDDSVLQAVWEVLRNFCQTESAIANIVQRFETATVSIAGLADIMQHDEGAEMIRERVELIQRTISMINAAVVDADAGEKYERKFATVNGLDTIWDRLAHSVSKAAQMPMTQLFGMSPSGLSSDDESGKANWRKQVSAYREDQLRDNLATYYTHLAGGPVDVEFPALDETTAREEAEIEKLRSEARANYVNAGVLGPSDVREKLAEERYIREADPDADAGEQLDLALDSIQLDPYPTPDDVPDFVPDDKAAQWADAWHTAYDETGSEERAFRAANTEVDL